MRVLGAFLASLGLQLATAQPHTHNSTYNNPILPGWHSDPSCTFVAERNNTFFCTTSSFSAFPGCPVYASADLTHWDLISNALNRPAQLPQIQTSTNSQTLGIFASTLRFHKGTFYLLTAWLNTENNGTQFVLFTTKDPYDDSSWTDAFHIENPEGAIDPDIFWDDDGQVIMAFSGAPIKAAYIDLSTGKAGEPFAMWNGTGYNNQEGPHLYKKDGYYYLLIAEGGTAILHSTTIARSKSIRGPWESSPHNPLVTARDTDRYFQTVGHSDLFQDHNGNWWGVALATRGGPTLFNENIFPMGRETVLYPVSWPKGDWPVADPVKGKMRGPLPVTPSKGKKKSPTFMGIADVVDFEPGSSIPKEWLFWRAPAKPESFTISPPGHPHTLRLTASRANLTGDASFKALDGLTLITRLQTNTLFEFSVDVHLGFNKVPGDEVGITVFLHQDHHIDLGIVMEEDSAHSRKLSFRCRATDSAVVKSELPSPVITPIPAKWMDSSIRLFINGVNSTHYELSAAPTAKLHERRQLAIFSASLVSGPLVFTGTLLGAYATTNGGTHAMEGYVSRWRYTPEAQQIGYGEFVWNR